MPLFQICLNGLRLSSFTRTFSEGATSPYYVVTLVRHQVCNMSLYRQIQEIFNQLNHVLLDAKGYCEKSKEYKLFMNRF